MKHAAPTPGPWEVTPLGREVRGADGGPVCWTAEGSAWASADNVGTRPKAQALADAHLIAAAPILLEAAEYAYKRLYREGAGVTSKRMAAAVARLEKAIARARGEAT